MVIWPAVPAIAGPAAVATVMLLRTQQQVPLWHLAAALLCTLLVTLATFLAGRQIAAWLGPRGINALEKLTGLLAQSDNPANLDKRQLIVAAFSEVQKVAALRR